MKKYISVKQDEEKIVPFIWLNDSESEIRVESILDNENSSVHIIGIFVGTKHHSITFDTAITHRAKNTKSRTTIRGVFLDNAAISNDGLIAIEQGAKKADGYFDSKILLFGDARGRSVPSLEIDENELKAGHASTVGRPDAEQLFYLRSRGLTEHEAEKLLVSGFFEPVLDLLPSSMKDEVKMSLSRAL